MIRADFEDQMNRLADLKSPPSSVDGHWEALKDIPLTMVKSAITHALRTRSWFPTGAELRADADHVARHTALAPAEPKVIDLADAQTVVVQNPLGGQPLTLQVVREWYHDCDVCSDSGWASRWCGETPPNPWTPRRACERRHGHAAHEWVEPCACIATNPTIQRRRAAGLKYVQPPEKVA